MHTERDVLVIGGGIAGLAAAWQLARSGQRVTVLEGSDRVGGLVHTDHPQGLCIESGPNAFLGNAAALLQLAHETGLDNEICEIAPQASNRFIYFRGTLHPLPRTTVAFLRSRLLTLRGKVRCAAEYWTRPITRAPVSHEESVATFVRRRFGTEVVQRLADPMVAGIFAGNPDQLSIQAAFPQLPLMEKMYGGILRAAIHSRRRWAGRSVRTFRHGMGALPTALAKHLGDAIVTQALVKELRRAEDGTFCATTGDGATLRQWRARHVICATPAYVTANLVQDIVSDAAAILQTIPYAPLVVIHLAYRRADCPHPLNGFGFLVPRCSAPRLLGSLWTSSAFAQRAPDDLALLTCFYGGMRDPEILEWSETALQQIAATDIQTTLGITAAPHYWNVVRHRAAIPQYTLGHCTRLEKLTRAIARVPGLALTGNYFTGTSVNDTIAHAIDTATRYTA